MSGVGTNTEASVGGSAKKRQKLLDLARLQKKISESSQREREVMQGRGVERGKTKGDLRHKALPPRRPSLAAEPEGSVPGGLSGLKISEAHFGRFVGGVKKKWRNVKKQ